MIMKIILYALTSILFIGCIKTNNQANKDQKQFDQGAGDEPEQTTSDNEAKILGNIFNVLIKNNKYRYLLPKELKELTLNNLKTQLAHLKVISLLVFENEVIERSFVQALPFMNNLESLTIQPFEAPVSKELLDAVSKKTTLNNLYWMAPMFPDDQLPPQLGKLSNLEILTIRIPRPSHGKHESGLVLNAAVINALPKLKEIVGDVSWLNSVEEHQQDQLKNINNKNLKVTIIGQDEVYDDQNRIIKPSLPTRITTIAEMIR